ncbi:Gfo/Idh/MocA family protein [Arthrobacter sp. A2-55]|uniref:Gfo/Idh/MocA family protein n=1 Tax=Arthrobacter sp. A2-55 TaxID=2897337 RepID=UPI0021CDC3AD|nr:Gfo/Idh/MocA family oxidoreductase [Arthrobacter sp. A2-55]MCU6482119.1 Gfo/Idh/MocA family oxidoreductase [Arthrobacter sp. A2-55]
MSGQNNQDRVLRVGLVGVGARATIGEWVSAVGNCAELVVTADISPAAVKRSTELFGTSVPFIGDYRDFVNHGVDAAIVTVPDDQHADVAEHLLRAGIAVYLEKPMATTAADADRILAAAFESGSRLYVGHNMRHMSVVTMMRSIIERGEIGDVKAVWCRHFVGHGGDYYFKDWHADRRYSNTLLLQKGAHDIDVIHWLAGGYTRTVSAMGDLMIYGVNPSRADNTGRLMGEWFSMDNWPPESQQDLNPVVDVEDISMVNMRLDNGALASYEQCHFTPDYWRNYTVIGSRGRMENFGDTGGGVIKVWKKRHEYQPDGDVEYVIGGDESGHGGADQRTMAEFMRFIRHGGATDTSPIAAREAVATAASAAESLRSGSMPVAVPPVEKALEDYFSSGQSRP